MTTDCGRKHGKWAVGIILGVIVSCTTITLAIVKTYSSTIDDLSGRTRQIEILQAGQTAKLDAIQKGQDRLEKGQERLELKLDNFIGKDKKP